MFHNTRMYVVVLVNPNLLAISQTDGLGFFQFSSKDLGKYIFSSVFSSLAI